MNPDVVLTKSGEMNVNYELSNHLGNVRIVLSDRKLVEPTSLGTAENGNLNEIVANQTYFTPDVLVYNDYYAFGMLKPDRHGETENYRYGFQGQEMDDEVKGKGNSVNYKYRMYDARIGRFFAVDPLTSKYPQWGPYNFSGNQVIHMIELEGLEPAENPKNAGTNEKRAMSGIDMMASGASKKAAEDNFFSRSAWSNDDSSLKGELTLNLDGKYVTDTPSDPGNKYNMKVSNSATFNVDESQAERTNNYESFVIQNLLENFATGNGYENYSFPTNGVISSKFIGSDVLNMAISDYKNGKPVIDKQYSFKGQELIKDVMKTGTMFGSITGFAGSVSITITPSSKGVYVQIFNITSLTSGDISKDVVGANPAKSYVKNLFEKTPYGNQSQTFNLFIPFENL